MSRQIAVRLPDDLVEFLDEQVRRGDSPSRATIVAHALERERRRTIAANDAAVLAANGDDSDMDGLALHAASLPIDLA